MHSKDRQKMCGHCDGRIPYEAENCPYCGFDLIKTAEPAKERLHRSFQESLTAPYIPSPARPVQGLQSPSFNPITPPSSMLEKKNSSLMSPLSAPMASSAPAETTATQEGRKAFFPILLLSLAGNFMTIGLLLLLFSDGGTLRLEWDASYWFVYCLIGLPLLFMGLKKAGALKE